MKKIFYITITFVLILSSLSFLGTAFMDHSAHQKCPFSILSSNDCETVADAAGSLFHHITASQELTNVLVTSGISTLLALLFAAVFLYLSNFFKSPTNFDQLYQQVVLQDKSVVSIPNPILRWIALHNKRSTHLKTVTVVT